MRNEQVKKNAVIFNKLTGTRYRVTDTETVSGQDGDEVNVIAERVDENDEIIPASENGERIVVSPDYGICYRVAEWPVDTEVPEGYRVNNGILCDRNGNPATEQGEIVVKTIIASLPGYLLLGVRTRDKKDGYIDLFTYEPGRDRFNKVIRDSIPSVTVERVFYNNEVDDSVLLSYVQKEDREEETVDDDGEETVETKTVVTGSALILVKDRKAASYRTGNEFIRLITVEDPTDSSLKRFLVEEALPDGGSLYRKISVDAENGGIYENGCMTAPEKAVRYASVTAAIPGECLIGDNFIQTDRLKLETPLIKDTDARYIVDVSGDEGKELKVTVVDKDLKNPVTIVKKNTADRGYVYSLIK